MRQTVTHYDVLGVSRDASEQEIRAAFRQLTIEHHPDKFAGSAREKAEEQFQRITEAFNVLSRPTLRNQYDKELSTGSAGKTMDRKEIARRLAAKGAQAFRGGQLAEAVDALEQAVKHDDENARAHYFLGVTLAQAKGRGDRDALRHLDRATTLEPDNAAMKAEAASLFLAAGMKARAVRLAEDALSLDPTSNKAQEVLNTVREQQKPAESEGLLGRFRRKG